MSGKNSRLAIWLPLVLALCLVAGMAIGNLFKNNPGREMPVKIFAGDDKLTSVLN
jgi:hypothetical protein